MKYKLTSTTSRTNTAKPVERTNKYKMSVAVDPRNFLDIFSKHKITFCIGRQLSKDIIPLVLSLDGFKFIL